MHTAILFSSLKNWDWPRIKAIIPLAEHPTSVRLAAADFADLLSALDPAMCRGMYQSRK